MKILVTFLLVGWMMIPLWSQVPLTVPLANSPKGPELTVGGDSTMVLTNLAIDVVINGFIAETKMTMTFFNPHDRILEGDLSFPIPEGSFVSGYALDIKGVMVDGVIVEKEKGRVVFEKIVRQGVDPGLVEWVEGNIFKTRIFPLPANGSRTVAVKYLSEIIYKNQEALFYLPLNFRNKIDNFSIRIEVLTSSEKPVFRPDSSANFEFHRWHNGFKAEAALKNYLPPADWVIALPGTPGQNICIEESPDGDYYFSILDWIEKNNSLEGTDSREPRYITILWDASASMVKTDHQEELDLLKAYFSSLKNKEIAVDLVLFHCQREKPRHFQLTKDNIDILIRTIKETQYDGGTSFTALTSKKDEVIPDFYLLFSDGRNNFGPDEPSVFKAPLYAFSRSAQANHAFLHSVAQQSGGMYFNLKQVDQDTVLKQIGQSPYSFISAKVEEGMVVGMFPHQSQPVSDRFVLAGILTSPQARITLNYGRHGKSLKQSTYTLSTAKAEKGHRVQTFWAQKKIVELLQFPNRNRQELLETGKKYGLVTPETSLIVLDNLEQYWQHKIMPPKSLPGMRKEYLSRLDQQQKNTDNALQNKLERLANLWNKRVNWWETTYPLRDTKLDKEYEHRSTNHTSQAADNESVHSFTNLRRHSRQYIAGSVVDANNVRLPGVRITLTRSSSNSSSETITNEKGEFIFAVISPGLYQIMAELEGLNTFIGRGIRLLRGGKLEFQIMMMLKALEETVVIDDMSSIINRHSTASVLNEEMESEPEEDTDNYSANSPSLAEESSVPLKKSSEDIVSSTGPDIVLKEWHPNTPYREGLKEAGIEGAYEAYLKQKPIYGSAPSFYLDCAEYFFKIGLKEAGLRVISNIAEMDVENPTLLRVLGYRLAQLDYLDISAIILEKVLQLRPEEPQSYRDLGLVLERLNRFEKAVDLLYHVILGQWDQRFGEIETIVLMELNNTLRKAKKAGFKGLYKKIDPRLCKVLDVDIRIVLTWDADMTAIDLSLIYPQDE